MTAYLVKMGAVLTGSLSAQAFERALELDPGRLYSRAQSGAIHLTLGAYADARVAFESALECAPGHPPAQCGAAVALLAAAKQHIAAGAPGATLSSLIYLSTMHDTLTASCVCHHAHCVMLCGCERRHRGG